MKHIGALADVGAVATAAITAADSYGYYDFYISMESSVLFLLFFSHSIHLSFSHSHIYNMCIYSSNVAAQQHIKPMKRLDEMKNFI